MATLHAAADTNVNDGKAPDTSATLATLTTGSPPSSAQVQSGISAESGSLPAAPERVYVVRVCDSMKMSFSKVDGTTGYDLNYTTDVYKRWWNRSMTNVGPNTHDGKGWWVATKFDRNATWLRAVRARNAHGEGPWTESDPAPRLAGQPA